MRRSGSRRLTKVTGTRGEDLIGSKEVCMRPTEDAIARAFGLATPVAPLKLVHHTSFETWHLSTGAGSYLVKRLWGLEDPVWRPHIERAISLEAAALASGLPVACPVEPTLDAGAR
jgi:hypothetical protein